MNRNTETFGSMVFNKAVMKASLPAGVFEAVMESVELSRPLSEDIAAEVADMHLARRRRGESNSDV